MEKEEIIQKLNIFYGLELLQLDIYSNQSRWANDIYLKRAFERVAAIEGEHVEYLDFKIKNMGGVPNKVVEVKAPYTMLFDEKSLSSIEPVTLMKLNIAFEEEIISMYRNLIIQSGGYEELFDLLWSNLMDEEFHTAWFINKLREMEARVN